MTRDYSDDLDDGNDNDTLYLVGGAALMLVGAGLLLSNKQVRRLVGDVSFASLVSTALPYVERYLRDM